MLFKRDDSIAGTISSTIMLRKLLAMITADMLIIVFACVFWAYGTEVAIAGDFYPGFERSFELGNGTWIWDRLADSTYTFASHTVYSGAFLNTLTWFMGVLGMIQVLIWSFSFLNEYFRIKKMLDPMNQIAINAMEMAQGTLPVGEFEKELVQIDPLSDVHISTGNRDLQGLEDCINTLLDKMREAYKVQSRFVSDASHELRTPIAVIKGYADMLGRWGKEDEEVLDEGITAIRKEADNMNRLVEQLLFLARSDNGRQTFRPVLFSLSDMVENVYNECVMIDKDHEYKQEIKSLVEVNGDENMIKECMRILVDNAKKYTPQGNEITIRAYVDEKGQSCFEVSDTGIGIAPDEIEHIFDRFYRSDPARNRESGGTGLGLAIAQTIAEYNNAYFDVVSYQQIGTRITMVFRNSKKTDSSKAAG